MNIKVLNRLNSLAMAATTEEEDLVELKDIQKLKSVKSNQIFNDFVQARIDIVNRSYKSALILLAKVKELLRGKTDDYSIIMMAFVVQARSVVVLAQGKPEDAYKLISGFVESYPKVKGDLYKSRLMALQINLSVAMIHMGKHLNAIEICEEVINKNKHSKALEIRALVAIAMLNKSHALLDFKLYEDTIAICNEMVENYAKSSELSLQIRAGEALINYSYALEQQGKVYASLKPLAEVCELYGTSKRKAMMDIVAVALVQKGSILLKIGDIARAEEMFVQAIATYGKISVFKIQKSIIKATADLAYIKFLQDDFSEALRYCDEGISRISKVIHDEDIEWESSRLNEIKQESKGKKINTGKIKHKSTSVVWKKHLHNALMPALGDKNRFFSEIASREKDKKKFLLPKSRFKQDVSFLLILREWNSYTPAIRDGDEHDRGGGYFIYHQGQGIVIDPGYNFLENFNKSGGRVHDIDHIIITHAHDDHTADFESVLSLLYQYNKEIKDYARHKRVTIYASQSALRKLNGVISLRDSNYIHRVVTLNSYTPRKPRQHSTLHLCNGVELTILPAYHDDVVSRTYALGLQFSIETKKGIKKIVFTSDTALFPIKRNSDGEIERYQDGTEKLDEKEELALYNIYPKSARHPDLFIPHIGSIKDYEFSSPSKDQPNYYPNHLGLLGIISMILEVDPQMTVISEFGSELKTIRGELLKGIKETIKQLSGNEYSIIPNDTTIAYMIDDDSFLAHSTCTLGECTFLPSDEIDSTIVNKRVVIFEKGAPELGLDEYKKALEKFDLPHFEKK